MKIKVTYEYDATYINSYFATTTLKGKPVYGCGKNWNAARENLLRQLEERALNIPDVPPAEEVELHERPSEEVDHDAKP